jgi:hypothetical protein
MLEFLLLLLFLALTVIILFKRKKERIVMPIRYCSTCGKLIRYSGLDNQKNINDPDLFGGVDHVFQVIECEIIIERCFNCPFSPRSKG